MNKRTLFAIFIFFLSFPVLSFSQEEDRNVMLNASSANKPRDISTGLPGEDAGAAILEDGAPLTVGLWPAYPYLHWAGGNSYSQIGLMSIESTALKTGIVNFGLDSHTWNVSEKLSGKVSAATSSFGLVKVDGAVVSPAGKNGWVNFGIYVNMDPTSTGEKSRSFVNNMRVYKIGFTKRFDEGTLSLQYKLTGDNSGVYGYSSAPFIYVGDGSIRELNGFRIGRDSYFPENDRIDFMDVQTGSMRSKSVKDMNRKHIHDAVLSWDGSAFGEWDLNASLHFSGTAGMNLAGIYSTGIDSASEGNLVQNRLGLLVEADYADVIADVTVSRRLGMHNVEAGLADWYGYMKCAGSSFFFAHTVEADPERVLNGGRSSWGYNQNAQYYYGNQNLVMLHAKDKFFVNSRFQLDYGFMTQLLWYDVKATVNPKGETCNLRREGFWIGDGLVRLQNISKVRLNYAALAGFNYDLGQGVFLAGEYLLSSKAKTVNDYGFADMPVNKPTVKHLARLGLQFEKRTGDLSLNASSMATWIASRNNSSILYLTKQISGVSETLSYTGIYGIDTFGWTSEASARWNGFGLHVLLTLQNPEYSDFRQEFTFSNGSSETIDYSGNFVTGMSRVLLELDPSFHFKKWNISASARYFSKQYANRLNNTWFDGHWETFASIGCQVRDDLGVKLDVVNFLNQTGISGSLDAADAITDTSLLKNMYIAGTYIRPLTFNIAVTYKF